MKRWMVVAVLAVAAGSLSAQTMVGHINSEAIMQALPEAVDAQRSLDAMVTQWEGELQKMQAEWKKKFDEYDRKKLILTEQTRAETERQLREMDQSITEYRNKKFGQNGERFL